MFENENIFARGFLEVIRDIIQYQDKSLADFLKKASKQVKAMKNLGEAIAGFVSEQNKKVVLMIDEVDKSSNNLLFLHFLGMLCDSSIIPFFYSVILVGVHDIKTLKRKLRPEDSHSLNSPWNIAVDFMIDMSFSAEETQVMLRQY